MLYFLLLTTTGLIASIPSPIIAAQSNGTTLNQKICPNLLLWQETWIPQKDTIPLPQKGLAAKGIKTPEKAANEALAYSFMSIFCAVSILLSPIGLVFGIIAISKGRKLLRRLKGSPNARKLRRKARWAILLGAISSLVFLMLLLLILYFLANPINIGDFDIGYGWCPFC